MVALARRSGTPSCWLKPEQKVALAVSTATAAQVSFQPCGPVPATGPTAAASPATTVPSAPQTRFTTINCELLLLRCWARAAALRRLHRILSSIASRCSEVGLMTSSLPAPGGLPAVRRGDIEQLEERSRAALI